jgi:hypothetical protein
MSRRAVLLALLSLLLSSSAAPCRAAFVEHTASVSLQLTDYTTSISVPQFDTIGGTLALTSVDFSIAGHVEGDVFLENLDAQAQTVSFQISATITLQRPGGGSTLVQTLPLTASSVFLNSGQSTFITGLSDDEFNTAAITAPLSAGDQAIFVGTGNINLPVVAIGLSDTIASNNVLAIFDTLASAQITVRYNYILTIPEPSSAVLAGLGGVIFLVFRGRGRRGSPRSGDSDCHGTGQSSTSREGDRHPA